MTNALTRLSGLLELGPCPHAASLGPSLQALKVAGFVDAYLGDVFLEVVPKALADPARTVFQEDECALQFRPVPVYEQLRELLAQNVLTAESAHYNQILPPPGQFPSDWVWQYHRRMLGVAKRLGLQRVTTHPGWLFGSAMERYVGDAARAYRAKQITQTALNRAAFERYGGDVCVWSDAVETYKRLCDWAGEADITVTIETAVSEWYDLTLYPERMLTFCDEVGATNLGICVDSGHCHLNGLNVADVIRICGTRMAETHFHDNYGERDEHNPVGEGTVDWPSVIQALRDISYTGVITFEQRAHDINSTRWRAWVDA